MLRQALLVSPEAPYPPTGGGSLRTAAILHYLARRYAVDAVLFREPGSPDPRAALPAGLVNDSITCALPYHSRRAPARAGRNLVRCARGVPPLTERYGGCEEAIRRFVAGRHYSLGLIEHSWCAPYLAVLRAHCDSMVLDLHNVESVLQDRCAATEPWPLSLVYRRFASAARRLEQVWLPRFDTVLAASPQDREAVLRLAPGTRAAVYPNTIPSREPVTAAPRRQIVFSANFEYHPNRSAVAWFSRKVWPLVRSRHPDVRWLLAGRNERAVRRWARHGSGIECTGEVADTMPGIAASMVAVVPLLAGSGTRLKILEAWAAGVPVVSTSLGAEGLPARDGEHLLIADSAPDFADAICRLLESEQQRRKLVSAGRSLCNSMFTWETGWKALAALGI